MPTLLDLDRVTKDLGSAHSMLVDELRLLNQEIESMKRAHFGCLRRLSASVVHRRAIVAEYITASPELFRERRSFTLHGIKVGWQKQRGTVKIADEQKTIERAQDLLAPDQVSEVIRTKFVLDKKALAALPAATLKRLGVEITADTDAIVIHPTANDVEKFVTALLAELASADEAKEAA